MGVVRLWLPCLGDVACHVIKVGTLRPNLHNQLWAGSSTVKRVLYCYHERSSVRIREKPNVFCHHFNLNWIWWSPSGLLAESCSGLAGLDQASWNCVDPDGLHQDSIQTPSGVHQEYTWSPAGCTMAATLRGSDGLQVDSRNNPWTLFGLLMESIRMCGSVSRPRFRR